MKNAVCWFEICVDGSIQWEMVSDEGKCFGYFPSRDAAIEYATENGINITEWIED